MSKELERQINERFEANLRKKKKGTKTPIQQTSHQHLSEPTTHTPKCQSCGSTMSQIKKEAKYGCLGQGAGLILIFIVGGWFFLPMLLATGASQDGNPFMIFLAVIILSIFALNGKKKIRVCQNCGYSFEIKK